MPVFAIALVAAVCAVIIGLWMRDVTPLPVSEWPVVPPPRLSVPVALPRPPLAASAPALERPSTPEPASKPAPAAAVVRPVANVPAPSTAPAATKSPAVAAEPQAASGTGEVTVILSVLDRYRLAFSSLNPGSVRAVWPGADVRALAREFADIKRQTLAFDSCRIDVQGAQAEAACTGRVSLVAKSGPPEPSVQTRRWVFTLAYESGAWRIRTAESR